MKTLLKYPRTTLELKKLLSFLDIKIKDIEDGKNPKNKSREWVRICQATNDIRKIAEEKIQTSKDSPKVYVYFNDDIHHRIIKDLEKWMKINNFPIW